MVIRGLKQSDIPAVIHLGGLMHDESEYSPLVYDPEAVVGACQRAISSEFSFVVVAESAGEIVGMLGAYVCLYPYGTEYVAQDHLVYVVPGYRGGPAFVKMVRKYIQWAKEAGAKMVLLGQTTGIDTDKVSKLYQRMGFELVGGIYKLRS